MFGIVLSNKNLKVNMVTYENSQISHNLSNQNKNNELFSNYVSNTIIIYVYSFYQSGTVITNENNHIISF